MCRSDPPGSRSAERVIELLRTHVLRELRGGFAKALRMRCEGFAKLQRNDLRKTLRKASGDNNDDS